MNVNDLFPSRFLKAHDLGGKSFTLTIRDVTLENVGHGQEQERKLTLAFEKATKMMLLNRTNAMIIASLYGPETDAWKGKAVIVYSARIKAFGAWHDALRIKEQIPARNVGAAQMTEAMQEDPPLDDENDLLDVDEGENGADAPEPPAHGKIDVDASQNATEGQNSASDDALWEPEQPERASQAQLDELNMLGEACYNEDWPVKLPNLVKGVTTGATDNIRELTPKEAQKLIDGITHKLAAEVQSTNGKKAAATNGTGSKAAVAA